MASAARISPNGGGGVAAPGVAVVALRLTWLGDEELAQVSQEAGRLADMLASGPASGHSMAAGAAALQPEGGWAAAPLAQGAAGVVRVDGAPADPSPGLGRRMEEEEECEGVPAPVPRSTGSDLSSAPSPSQMVYGHVDDAAHEGLAASAMTQNPLAAMSSGGGGGGGSSSAGRETVAAAGGAATDALLAAAAASGASAAGGVAPAGPGVYELTFVTGGKVGAGLCASTLHVSLAGAHGEEGAAEVRREGGGAEGEAAPPSRFQRGATDVVQVDVGRDVGEVAAVRVWHDGEVSEAAQS